MQVIIRASNIQRNGDISGTFSDTQKRLGVMMSDPSVAVEAMQAMGADVQALKERFDCVIPYHSPEQYKHANLATQ